MGGDFQFLEELREDAGAVLVLGGTGILFAAGDGIIDGHGRLLSFGGECIIDK